MLRKGWIELNIETYDVGSLPPRLPVEILEEGGDTYLSLQYLLWGSPEAEVFEAVSKSIWASASDVSPRFWE